MLAHVLVDLLPSLLGLPWLFTPGGWVLGHTALRIRRLFTISPSGMADLVSSSRAPFSSVFCRLDSGVVPVSMSGALMVTTGDLLVSSPSAAEGWLDVFVSPEKSIHIYDQLLFE